MSVQEEIQQLETLLEHWTEKPFNDKNAKDLRLDIKAFRKNVDKKFPNCSRKYWNNGEYIDTEFEDAVDHISHYLENGDQERYSKAVNSVKTGLNELITYLKAKS